MKYNSLTIMERDETPLSMVEEKPACKKCHDYFIKTWDDVRTYTKYIHFLEMKLTLAEMKYNHILQIMLTFGDTKYTDELIVTETKLGSKIKKKQQLIREFQRRLAIAINDNEAAFISHRDCSLNQTLKALS